MSLALPHTESPLSPLYYSAYLFLSHLFPLHHSVYLFLSLSFKKILHFISCSIFFLNLLVSSQIP
jgi:hypothetical protein